MTVTIWIVSIPDIAPRQTELLSLLSPEEQARSTKFVSAPLTTKYIAAHGALKLILATTLGVPPQSLTYDRARYGKPYLKDRGLHFNMSDAHDFALIALSTETEVGIDVDRVKPDIISKGIHSSVFQDSEIALLNSLPPHEQPEAFFWAWTAKEALLKLIGTGLYKEMRDFAVPQTHLTQEVSVELESAPRYIRNFRVASGYVATIASNLPNQELIFKRELPSVSPFR